MQWFEKINNYYVKASEYHSDIKRCRPVYLHRFVTNAKEHDYVDHKENTRTLDNRKQNLRVTTNDFNSQNRRGANKNNKLGVRNVCYIEKNDEYWVQFSNQGKRYKWVFSGNEYDKACKFAKEKRKELFGEFAGKG